MSHHPLQILYEDNHLLAVNKPAGLVTQGSQADEQSLLVAAKAYLKDRYQKPGNVYLGVVSRLDAFVTGVVILARTSKAAARLNEQFAANPGPRKTYWAIVERAPAPPVGVWEDWLRHDDAQHRVLVATPQQAGAKSARLRYRTPAADDSAALLEIELETGRKHQIRVQLAARGLPVVGDRKYGSCESWPSGIALHARGLEILHPTTRERICLTAPLPAAWKRVARLTAQVRDESA